MRVFIAVLTVCVLVSPAPLARAMNWEGHDDWMVDMEPARILEAEASPATKRPLRPCPTGHDAAPANPYEQILLPHRGDCPSHIEGPKPER